MENSLAIPFFKRQKFHKNYLKVTAFIVGSFGPVFFLSSMLWSAEPARLTLDLLAWPVDGIQTFREPSTRFLSALTGGFLSGWGITIWFLSAKVYNKAPDETRLVILYGVMAWFIIDSSGSVASGNASNVLFNVFFFCIGTWPLWFKANDCSTTQDL